ncbi:MAG TPA: hypothetical protein VGO09_04940 [Flavisolibacter sp.]|nr:hypothetical protein [Flavisolibacter sp.]
MAKQAGPCFITGTIDDVIFYKMNGKYYARYKYNPSKQTLRTKACYKSLREQSIVFSKAAKLASQIYRSLPADLKKFIAFGKLIGKVITLEKEDKTGVEIKDIVINKCAAIRKTSCQ